MVSTLDLLPAINGISSACNPLEFCFVLIRFVGTGSLCCLFKKKMQLFTSNCLSENYPSMKKKKESGPITISEKQLNIIINYTVNCLGLRWKGVCLSLKLMYFDSAPGGNSL